MRQLLIIFGRQGDVTTGIFDDGVLQNVLSSLPDTPTAAPNEGRSLHAWVVIPGEDVVQHFIDIPTVNEKKALEAVPYLLEDVVAGNLNDLHFATGATAAGRRFAGVISRSLLKDYIDRLSAQNISADVITPDYLAAGHVQEASISLDAERAIITLPDNAGLTVETSLVTHVLPPILRAASISIIQRDADPSTVLSVAALLPGLNITNALPPTTRQWLQAIYDQLTKRVVLNLRQGSFAVQRNWTFSLQPLRRAAAFALILLAFFIIQRVVSGVHHNTDATRALAAADSAARSVLPAGARLVNARVQTQSLAASLKAGSADSFLAMSEQLAEALTTVAGASVQSIQYDETRQALSVGVIVPSYDAMAALRTQLSKSGSDVADAGARQAGDAIMGDLVMRRP